jgi:hypothetical protein
MFYRKEISSHKKRYFFFRTRPVSVTLLAGILIFTGKVGYMSSHGQYFKEFPGLTAGDLVSYPKMVDGEDVGLMRNKLESLEETIDVNQTFITELVENFFAPSPRASLFRSALSISTSENEYESCPATPFFLKNKDGNLVYVPLALHVKKGTPEIVKERLAAEFVTEAVWRERFNRPSVPQPRTDTRVDPLRMVVWIFRLDYNQYDRFTGPKYLKDLQLYLMQATDDPARLKKVSLEKVNPREDVPTALVAKILLSFLSNTALDSSIWNEIEKLESETQAAFGKFIVTLTSHKHWTAMKKTIIPRAEKNFRGTEFQNWLLALTELN